MTAHVLLRYIHHPNRLPAKTSHWKEWEKGEGGRKGAICFSCQFQAVEWCLFVSVSAFAPYSFEDFPDTPSLFKIWMRSESVDESNPVSTKLIDGLDHKAAAVIKFMLIPLFLITTG